MLMFLSLPAYAADGDGTGGGKGEPLGLVSSSPYNGQKDVPINVLVTMTFTKNVVNMTVSENNLKCFTLYAADGSMVPIDVIMADDQIEPEKKNDVSLKPLKDLKHDTAYTVIVSSALKSKSGVTLADDLKVAFTTLKDSAAVEPAVSSTVTPQPTVDLPPANVNTQTPAAVVEPQVAQAGKSGQGGADIGSAAAPGSSPAVSTGDNTKNTGADSQSGETGKPGGGNESELPLDKPNAGLTWAIIIAGLAIVAAAGYALSRKKK
jgi:Bacterial Ig-like domain